MVYYEPVWITIDALDLVKVIIIYYHSIFLSIIIK